MSPMIDASTFLEELEGYDPEYDRSEPLTFSDLYRRLPYYRGSDQGLRVVNVSNFAEMGYCPYKIWHIVRGTPVVRPPRVIEVVQGGTRRHVLREAQLTGIARKAKPATRKQLRDPSVDIVEMPEFRARFRRENWLYRAKLDGLARLSGNLVVRELKTGRYAQKPDHLLQVWAYCLASPGAVSHVTSGDFRARQLTWEVLYPNLSQRWGPFLFRNAQLALITKGLTLFETAGAASAAGENLDLRWRSFPAKCAPCGFSHACTWKIERRPTPVSTVNTRLIPLEQFAGPRRSPLKTHEEGSRRRHRDDRTRRVR